MDASLWSMPRRSLRVGVVNLHQHLGILCRVCELSDVLAETRLASGNECDLLCTRVAVAILTVGLIWFWEERDMAWTTPTLVEICLGLEINGYLPAEI